MEDILNVEEENKGFIIDSDDKADWALEKIKEARANMDKNKETAEAIIAKKEEAVKAWLSKENEHDENTIEFMTAKLKEYSISKLEEINKNRKKKVYSFNLPEGKVGFKKKADEFSIGGVKCSASNADLLNVVGESYIKVTTTKTVDWAGFKKLLTVDDDKVINSETGEVLPIDVKIGEYEFTV